MPRTSREWHPQVPAPEPGDRTLHNYDEAARILRRSPDTLRKYVKDGLIPAHLVTVMANKAVFFTGDQLRQIIDVFAAAPPPAQVRRRRPAA
jgi:hypothetical protein